MTFCFYKCHNILQFLDHMDSGFGDCEVVNYCTAKKENTTIGYKLYAGNLLYKRYWESSIDKNTSFLSVLSSTFLWYILGWHSYSPETFLRMESAKDFDDDWFSWKIHPIDWNKSFEWLIATYDKNFSSFQNDWYTSVYKTKPTLFLKFFIISWNHFTDIKSIIILSTDFSLLFRFNFHSQYIWIVLSYTSSKIINYTGSI